MNSLEQNESTPQYAKMYIKEITAANIINSEDLLVCFVGRLGEESDIYSVKVNIKAVLAEKATPGIVPDETAQTLKRNVYTVHYQNVAHGCPDNEHDTSVQFGMLDREDTSAWGDYARLRPPAGSNIIVYGVDQKWREPLILIVGNFAIEKSYIAFRFMQTPMPPLKYSMSLKTFALVVDTLFFPVEWLLLLSFKG